MPASTPNFAWPYQLLTDPPNGASLGHDGLIAADATVAAEVTNRINGDNTLQANINAAGLGRMGSYQNTSGATSATSEVKLGQFTFTANAARRYRLFVSGPQNNVGSGTLQTASLLRARIQSGSTVAVDGGTVALEVQAVDYGGLTEMTCGVVELPPGTFTSGTWAVGLFFQGVLINSGTSKYGNGAAQPSIVYVDDIGT